jgi:hypothetical protein
MTTTVSANGRARKSLADQIDRLDAILDGLSQNLDGAVATAVAGAVKEAIKAAVQEAAHTAVIEVLANKEVLRRPDVMPTAASQPPVTAAVRLADTARRCWNWLSEVAHDTWESVTTVAQIVKVRAVDVTNQFLGPGRATVQQVCGRAATEARAGWMRLVVLVAFARQLGRRLPVALGVGVAVGVVAYLVGPLVVPVACGLAGFTISLLAGTWEPLRWGSIKPEAGS